MNENIKIITSNKNWMEHTAIVQLENIAQMKGVNRAVGLPDLHAGKSPVGIVLETDNIVYPHIIGNDIGCGMGLFETGIGLKQFKQDRWVTKLNYIRALEDLGTENRYDEESPIYDLGTIGGGNHFAEFQKVNTIECTEEFNNLGIDKAEILLLIHSGSRGYGQRIMSEFLDFNGFCLGSEKAEQYLKKHDDALIWAERNRNIVADKLVKYLGYTKEVKRVIDCTHNYVERKGNTMIHRKGSVSSENGAVVVPGSRGSLTYIVKPIGNTDISLHSLSHGAGRKWARSLCKSRIKDKYNRDTIRETALKSSVVCHDTQLLYEEAPEAYKNIEYVITSLLEFGLIKVVATLKPLITYKG